VKGEFHKGGGKPRHSTRIANQVALTVKQTCKGGGKPHKRELKQVWAVFQGGGKPHRRELKQVWAVFQGGGKPRPYHDYENRGLYIPCGNTFVGLPRYKE